MELTYKKVMHMIDIIQNKKKESIHDLLNIPYSININDVIEYILKSRFKPTTSKNNERIFDYLVDFDLIYALFRKEYNIDLIKEDIGWWEFTAILEEILLSNNSLTKRMGYRGYKTPKKIDDSNKEEVKFYQNKKLQYKLEEKSDNVNKELGRMFKSLEKR